MFGDLIPASYTEVYSAFANEGRDIGGGKEDEGYRVILDKGDVEASFTAELYVRPGKEVKSCLLKTSLWSRWCER